MTKEQRYFITLLSDYIHGRQSKAPAYHVNWSQIASIASEQVLSGIIYQQCRKMKKISTSAERRLKEGYFSDVYQSVNSDCAYREVADALEKSEIDYLPFKGTMLRNYYPVPELRTMGDRDILIRHKDRKKSDQAVLALGYTKFVDNIAVWTYVRPYLMFEIHDVMFYEHLSNGVDYRGYFSNVWNSAVRVKSRSHGYVPDPAFHFLYLMAHTAKHLTNKGMGFRAFLDMVFFCRNAERVDGKAPDWEQIRTELEELSLYEFTCVCFSLCEAWFGVSMPFEKKRLEPGFARLAAEKIFRDGLFGLSNEDNASAQAAKEIRRYSGRYSISALKLMVRRVCPRYDDMRVVKWYGFLDGRPWLLPIAWAYRWIHSLKHKSRQGWALVTEPYRRKKQIEERELYLSRWGL